MKTTNKDPGSLNVGNNKVEIGQLILIKGEDRPRKVTYVMGSVERGNLHACFKGSGSPIPLGEIEWEIVLAIKPVQTPDEMKKEIGNLQKQLEKMTA